MGPLGLIAGLIEHITALLPDKLIAVSEHTAQALATELHVPQQKIVVVPNGVSIGELEDIPPADSISDVLVVGRLLSHKNIDIVIQSLALLKSKYPTIKCIIVGKGPEKEHLLELVAKLDLAKHVEFIESIEDYRQLYALMKASRVFAFPSTREGFGIVALEANGCGLPVITTDHPQNAARYLIEEGINGKVISLSPENLAEAIESYMATNLKPGSYISLLQQYDWDNLAQRVEDIYQSKNVSKHIITTTERARREAQAASKHEEALVGGSKLESDK